MFPYKTIREKKGYRFSDGTGGKKWVRGRTMFSEGCKYMGNNDKLYCIVKTDLDTGRMELASITEAKRFLCPEDCNKYTMDVFSKFMSTGAM